MRILISEEKKRVLFSLKSQNFIFLAQNKLLEGTIVYSRSPDQFFKNNKVNLMINGKKCVTVKTE